MQLCSRAWETWTSSLSSSSQTSTLGTCREQDRWSSVSFTITQTESFALKNYIFLTFLFTKTCPRFLLSTQNRSTETGKNSVHYCPRQNRSTLPFKKTNKQSILLAIVLFLWFPPLQLLIYVRKLDMTSQNQIKFWIVPVCKYNFPPSSLHSLQRPQLGAFTEQRDVQTYSGSRYWDYNSTTWGQFIEWTLTAAAVPVRVLLQVSRWSCVSCRGGNTIICSLLPAAQPNKYSHIIGCLHFTGNNQCHFLHFFKLKTEQVTTVTHFYTELQQRS